MTKVKTLKLSDFCGIIPYGEHSFVLRHLPDYGIMRFLKGEYTDHNPPLDYVDALDYAKTLIKEHCITLIDPIDSVINNIPVTLMHNTQRRNSGVSVLKWDEDTELHCMAPNGPMDCGLFFSAELDGSYRICLVAGWQHYYILVKNTTKNTQD